MGRQSVDRDAERRLQSRRQNEPPRKICLLVHDVEPSRLPCSSPTSCSRQPSGNRVVGLFSNTAKATEAAQRYVLETLDQDGAGEWFGSGFVFRTDRNAPPHEERVYVIETVLR